MCTSTQQLKRRSPWWISQMTENCDGYKICSQIIWFSSLLGIKLNSPCLPSVGCSEWLDSNEQKWGRGCDTAETRSKDHYSVLLAFSLGSHTLGWHLPRQENSWAPSGETHKLRNQGLLPIAVQESHLLYGSSGYNQAFRLKLLDKHWSRTTQPNPYKFLTCRNFENMKRNNLLGSKKKKLIKR